MSNDAQTTTTTHDDGRHLRTALVADTGNDGGSIAIVDRNGTRLALINLFVYDNGNLIVDVIDVDDRYNTRNALTFVDGHRQFLPASKVISADFRNKETA